MIMSLSLLGGRVGAGADRIELDGRGNDLLVADYFVNFSDKLTGEPSGKRRRTAHCDLKFLHHVFDDHRRMTAETSRKTVHSRTRGRCEIRSFDVKAMSIRERQPRWSGATGPQDRPLW